MTRKKKSQGVLIPTHPPHLMPGDEVVVRFYEDGWRWTVVDARVMRPTLERPGTTRRWRQRHRSTKPTWLYTIQAVRPTDGKVVKQECYGWRLKHSDGREIKKRKAVA